MGIPQWNDNASQLSFSQIRLWYYVGMFSNGGNMQATFASETLTTVRTSSGLLTN